MASLTLLNPEAFDNIQERLSRAVGVAVAHGLDMYMAMVLDETESGMSPIDGAFEDYSNAYKDYKESILGRPSSPVNLRVSGSINDYDIEVDVAPLSSVGELYFSGNTYDGTPTGQALFIHQKGLGGSPVRRIFPEKIEELPTEIKEEIRLKIIEEMNNA